MKAADFAYEKPVDLASALDLLNDEDRDIQLLAGGQSLMPMMNFRLAQPELLIDLNGVDELNFIEEEGEVITIGAMARYSQLQASPIISQHVPLFTLALPHIAHAAVRNRGTIGGSVALADPAAEMPALLIALGATITVISKSAEREISARDFFIGIYETALGNGELVKSVTVPKAKKDNVYGFYELTRRHGDYAMAGVAIAAGSIDPVSDLKIVLFSVSDKPRRLKDAEAVLDGKDLDNADAHASVKRALTKFEFQGDLNADAKTKQHLAGVVIKRTLEGMV